MWKLPILKSISKSLFGDRVGVNHPAPTNSSTMNHELQDVIITPVPSTTSQVTQSLADKNDIKRAWYGLTSKESALLTAQVIRDVTWVIFSNKGYNVGLKQVTGFAPQTAGQVTWAAITVLGTTPLNAAFWSYVYKEKYLHCLLGASIVGLAEVSGVVPWDGFAYLGQKFFSTIGCSVTAVKYLSAIFPGPGTAEGMSTALTNTVLSQLFDPNFKLNLATLGLNFSPINWVSGDAWALLFNALLDIAVGNTGGLIAQIAVVALTSLLLEYLTIIGVNVATEKLKERFESCRKEYESLNLFGMTKENKKEEKKSAESAKPVAPAYTTTTSYTP